MTDLITTEQPPVSELTTEYVAGDAFLRRRTGLRVLSRSIDDLTADFGDDFYDRVLLDPTATATLNIMRASIIEDGLRLSSPIADKAADGYDLGQEITAFCTAVLADMSTTVDDVLWDMLRAIAIGSRVAELVWEQRTARSWYVLDASTAVSQSQTLLTLKAIKVKPRRATSFVVDAFMNVHGLLAPQSSGGATSMVVSNGSANPDLLPRDKFLIYSFRPEHGDPRGTTAYRAAFNPWNIKQQTYPELLKFLAQFASPSIYATIGERAKPIRVTAADGTITEKSPVVALQEMLIQFQNGSAAAFDYGTLLNLLQSSGGGEAFFTTLTHCDQQIALGVLHQTLATLEAQHQARSSSEVHQDTGDTIIRQAKRGLAESFRRDCLRPLVRYNYGDRAAQQLTPLVSLGSVEQQDLAKMITAIAQLARARYLDVSQLPGIDTLLGLPVRMEATADPSNDPANDPAADPNAADDSQGDTQQGGAADESV
jgi:hypothetical protein